MKDLYVNDSSGSGTSYLKTAIPCFMNSIFKTILNNKNCHFSTWLNNTQTPLHGNQKWHFCLSLTKTHKTHSSNTKVSTKMQATYRFTSALLIKPGITAEKMQNA